MITTPTTLHNNFEDPHQEEEAIFKDSSDLETMTLNRVRHKDRQIRGWEEQTLGRKGLHRHISPSRHRLHSKTAGGIGMEINSNNNNRPNKPIQLSATTPRLTAIPSARFRRRPWTTRRPIW